MSLDACVVLFCSLVLFGACLLYWFGHTTFSEEGRRHPWKLFFWEELLRAFSVSDKDQSVIVFVNQQPVKSLRKLNTPLWTPILKLTDPKNLSFPSGFSTGRGLIWPLCMAGLERLYHGDPSREAFQTPGTALMQHVPSQIPLAAAQPNQAQGAPRMPLLLNFNKIHQAGGGETIDPWRAALCSNLATEIPASPSTATKKLSP